MEVWLVSVYQDGGYVKWHEWRNKAEAELHHQVLLENNYHATIYRATPVETQHDLDA